jgi:tetratricopeptide (TPR) repeat protein
MRISFAPTVMAGLLMAGPAFAQDSTNICPDPADYSTELDGLITQAQDAANEGAGREVSGKMWEVWLRAPNEQAQEVLDRGMQRRNSYDFAGAFKDFDRLADYCPTYAEGFNQRAYIQYLQGDYLAALADLDAALVLSPNHVAAQSGRALSLMQLGRMVEARTQMLEALANNPWLSERALVAKNAPLGPKGEDI